MLCALFDLDAGTLTVPCSEKNRLRIFLFHLYPFPHLSHSHGQLLSNFRSPLWQYFLLEAFFNLFFFVFFLLYSLHITPLPSNTILFSLNLSLAVEKAGNNFILILSLNHQYLSSDLAHPLLCFDCMKQ